VHLFRFFNFSQFFLLSFIPGQRQFSKFEVLSGSLEILRYYAPKKNVKSFPVKFSISKEKTMTVQISEKKSHLDADMSSLPAIQPLNTNKNLKNN
jgi:hypothetical protein